MPITQSLPLDSGGGGFDFLSPLFQARPQFLTQQRDLLNKLGPSLRKALFRANPELADLAGFLQESFERPIPRGLQQGFQDQFRTALAARGFGSSGGVGPAFQEAQFLTQVGENRRLALAPQLASFGQQVLGATGLGAPPQIDLGTFGSLQLQAQQLAAIQAANQQQSAFSQRLFDQLFPQPFSQPRSFSTIVGGGAALGGGGFGGGFSFSGSGNALAGGGGNAGFAAGQGFTGMGARAGFGEFGDFGGNLNFGTRAPIAPISAGTGSRSAPAPGAALQGGETVFNPAAGGGSGGGGAVANREFNTGDPTAKLVRLPDGRLIQGSGEGLAALLNLGGSIVG